MADISIEGVTDASGGEVAIIRSDDRRRSYVMGLHKKVCRI